MEALVQLQYFHLYVKTTTQCYLQYVVILNYRAGDLIGFTEPHSVRLCVQDKCDCVL